MDTESWTLDELARRAGQALAADAVHAPNGRVRDRPDGRAIRWYSTIGLVDRPFTGPGRAARYGPRHLLQLVAVKRLQALGRSLAQIQAELTGATDATLRRIAQLPEGITEPPHDTVTSAETEAVTEPELVIEPAPVAGPAQVAELEPQPAKELAPAARFWAAPPARADLAAPVASAPAKPRRIVDAAVRYEIALDRKSVV